MPKQPRPPMPKLPPFALAEPLRPKRKRRHYLLIFWLLFALPLFLSHIVFLSLPFFWDELGQFVPTALDILRHGWWVAHSTVPNVHPPGVEAYLALLYRIFGYSIPLTRVAMLFVASIGLVATFLLAIDLCVGTTGAPAFLPPLLLLASPLFYTQSMMAQLDMPAMVFTLLALLLFLKREYAWAAVTCVALVLVKETGLIVPFVFFVMLVWRKQWKLAAYFVAPAVALGCWLVFLHAQTGYWLGDPGFAHYNVGYSLNPVRMVMSFARRIYYLFFAEFRWIGTLVILFALRSRGAFRNRMWQIAASVAGGNLILVSMLGGAELERYLLPTLPIFYIAVAVGLTYLPKKVSIAATGALVAGLVANLWWNPPYPSPYENNLAMVDFVRLQEQAAAIVESTNANRVIATAWPYTAGLRDPDFGFVKHPMRVIELGDFHADSVKKAGSADTLITYTRTWMPENGVARFGWILKFLSKFYEWEPDVTASELRNRQFQLLVTLSSRGQSISIYKHVDFTLNDVV